MKRYIDPKANKPTQPEAATDEPAQAFSSFDVLSQLDKCYEVLNREIRNLMSESTRGKLSQNSARDLVNYLKLLSELKNEIETDLKDRSNEELEAISKQNK